MAFYRLASGILYATNGRAPARSVLVPDAVALEELEHTGERALTVGADVLVDEQPPETEQLGTPPPATPAGGEDLDSDDGIVGHEPGR